MIKLKNNYKNKIKMRNKIKNLAMGLVVCFLIISLVSAVPPGPEDCGPGYIFDTRAGPKCIQENCNDIEHAHYSYTFDCICGSSGSINENPEDPNKECSYPSDYKACPGCLYACVPFDEPCPETGETEENCEEYCKEEFSSISGVAVVSWAGNPPNCECSCEYEGVILDCSAAKECNDLCYKKCGSECYGAVDGGDCYCYYEPYSVSIDRNEEDCDELCHETYGSECYGLVDGSDCYCYYKLERPDITPPDISSGEQVEEEDENSDAAPKLTNEQREKVNQILDALNETLNDDRISDEEKALIQLIITELSGVEGNKESIMKGGNSLIKAIYDIGGGNIPALEDIETMWDLHTLRNIGSLVRDRQQKTDDGHLWDSTVLDAYSKDALLDAINESIGIKNGEHKTITVKKRSSAGGGTAKITVVKGHDGTISYTLDGKKYFGGGDIDRKLNPGMWGSVSDYIGDTLDNIRDAGIGTNRPATISSADEKNMYARAMDVHQEFGVNTNANKNLQEQLNDEMGQGVFDAIRGRLQSAVESGDYAADKMTSWGVSAIGHSVMTTADQVTRDEFANLAVLYCKQREAGTPQARIKSEEGSGGINDRLDSIDSNTARIFGFNKNPQIIYDQFEKVYQRYKISKEPGN